MPFSAQLYLHANDQAQFTLKTNNQAKILVAVKEMRGKRRGLHKFFTKSDDDLDDRMNMRHFVAAGGCGKLPYSINV